MKPSLVLAVLLAAAGCKKPAAAPTETPAAAVLSNEIRRLNWATYSREGAEVRQAAPAANDCTTTCAINGVTSWSRRECVGLDTDFRFVSNDCGQLLVLLEQPEAKGALSDRIIGALYIGQRERVPLRLNRFMQSSAGIRDNPKRMLWLAGVLGVPGKAPSLSVDGSSVDFVTIDQIPHSIPFAVLDNWGDNGPINPETK